MSEQPNGISYRLLRIVESPGAVVTTVPAKEIFIGK